MINIHRVSKFFAVAFLAAVVLAACGGGGGGNPGGGPPPTNPPTSTPQTVTFSGTVTQLSGSLAHNPTPCATSSVVPCPSPGIPATPSPTPAAGAPIGGANVYVTTAAGVFTSGTPNPVLATATTAPDGTFTTPALQVSAFSGSKAGIVVLNGSSVSSTNGLTDKGYAVLHAQVAVSGGNVIVPNLEVDSLSSDEAAGAPEIENVRKSKGLGPTAVDEYALEALRYSAQDDTGAGSSSCTPGMTPLQNLYSVLGGSGQIGAFVQDIANPTLSGAIDVMYQSPSANEVWAAATGPMNEPVCGNGLGNGYAYYQIVTITQ